MVHRGPLQSRGSIKSNTGVGGRIQSDESNRRTPIGRIPVFPLPDFVLFPNTLVPFHIFEPRYVQMMEDCLAGSRLVAITGLLPGWESDYYGNPPIHRVGCVGKVVNEERLEGGRLNIYAWFGSGLLREPHMERSYRTARGVLLPDYPLADPDLGWQRVNGSMVASELRVRAWRATRKGADALRWNFSTHLSAIVPLVE